MNVETSWKRGSISLFEKDEDSVGITVTGGNNRNEKESEISMYDIFKALKGMKGGKATGWDICRYIIGW